MPQRRSVDLLPIVPPLNALHAFEAAARHLSLTKAAQELHVTAGALSHQIRGLEELLSVKLFERHVRSIALTPAGKLLFPGLQTGFVHTLSRLRVKVPECCLRAMCWRTTIYARGG